METLIRCSVLQYLICVCTVCQCPTKRTLGLYGLISHQQIMSYGEGGMAYSLIQQTGGARDQTRDPWIQGKWFIHNTMGAPLFMSKYGSFFHCFSMEYMIFSQKHAYLHIHNELFEQKPRCCNKVRIFYMHRLRKIHHHLKIRKQIHVESANTVQSLYNASNLPCLKRIML